MSGRDVPELYRGIAAAADTSRAAALKLFCLECVGYVRKDVTECTATQCPLWRWRPYQQKGDCAPIRREQPAALRLYQAGMGVDSDENEIDGAEADFEGLRHG